MTSAASLVKVMGAYVLPIYFTYTRGVSGTEALPCPPAATAHAHAHAQRNAASETRLRQPNGQNVRAGGQVEVIPTYLTFVARYLVVDFDQPKKTVGKLGKIPRQSKKYGSLDGESLEELQFVHTIRFPRSPNPNPGDRRTELPHSAILHLRMYLYACDDCV